ncbi:ankyrin repeat-containing domain protein [Aspergillus aurantiobrunneus]
MHSLLYLPNELLLDIATSCNTQDLGRLTCTCWPLHNLLNLQLYRRGVQVQCDPPLLVYAAETRNPGTAQRVLQYTAPSPDTLSEALMRICKKEEKGNSKGNENDTTIARLLLAHGACPNTNQPGAGSAPLFTAALHRHLELVEILLEAGARATGYTLREITLLITHCTKLDDDADCATELPYDPRILQLLVQHGMHTDRNPSIVWRLLTQNCRPSVFGLLVDLGLLDPNLPKAPKDRPLYLVINEAWRGISEECAYFVRKCIEHGTDINIWQPGQPTLLHLAVLRNLPDVVRELIAAGAAVNARGRDGLTPLHQGRSGRYEDDDVDIAQTLLDAGADMAAVDDEGRQHVLMRVINSTTSKRANYPCMRLLLDRGLERIPAVDPGELMLAAVYLDDVRAVRRILQCGDIDLARTRNQKGDTALMLAARLGYDSIITALMEYSHTVERVPVYNQDGDSVLHLAMYTRKPSTARLLMQVQCSRSFNVYNRAYKTPLTIAVQLQPAAVVEELVDKSCECCVLACLDCDKNTLLHHAVLRGDAAMTELLLERKAARGFNNAQETPFSIAIHKGREDLVRLFLAHGESVEQRDGHGNTALMVAVLSNSLKIVQQLMAAGADIEASSESSLRRGTTALMMAMSGPTPDIAQFLLDSGADATGKRKGKTVLIRAIQRNWHQLALAIMLRLRQEGSDELPWAGRPDSIREK